MSAMKNITGSATGSFSEMRSGYAIASGSMKTTSMSNTTKSIATR